MCTYVLPELTDAATVCGHTAAKLSSGRGTLRGRGQSIKRIIRKTTVFIPTRVIIKHSSLKTHFMTAVMSFASSLVLRNGILTAQII
jgi:hypothetical protein